jgi:hypothetical protein
VAASADGTVLASASGGPEASGYCEVCVWCAATGRKQHVLMQHRGGVRRMAFSPDGVWLASASAGAEGLVALWDVGSGRAVAVGHTAGGCAGLAWLRSAPGASDVEFVTGGAPPWRRAAAPAALPCPALPCPALQHLAAARPPLTPAPPLWACAPPLPLRAAHAPPRCALPRCSGRRRAVPVDAAAHVP